MRQPKPYFKATHHAWYANIGPGKRPVRLADEDEGEAAAWQKYHALMAGRQPLNGDCRVVDILERVNDEARVRHVASGRDPRPASSGARSGGLRGRGASPNHWATLI